MNFLYEPGFDSGAPVIGEKELHHLKVLRVNSNEPICVTDGKGKLYTIRIKEWEKNIPVISVEKSETISQSQPHLHLAIGILQSSERMEWLVEKCTELGVHQISFVVTSRCERTKINLNRLESSAVGAMKQSRQAWLPVIAGPIKFEEILKYSTSTRFIACTEKRNHDQLVIKMPPKKDCLILVGPEGDFTPGEQEAAVENGFDSVGLGENILRAETAAFTASQIFKIRQLL